MCADADVPSYVARRNGDGCTEHEAWLRAALAEMVVLGAVAVVESEPHCVARVNVIPKSTEGKFRIIVDLRELNKHVRKTSFHYDTLASSREMFNTDDWMFSLDLEAGYYHVGVHPSHWRFLGFRAFGRFYVFQVLPFGLSDACRAFTKVMHIPVSVLRARGFRIMPYLDDFLVALARRDQAAVEEVCALFDELGFLLNRLKCVLELTRRIVSLGFIVDTTTMTCEVSARRVVKMIAAVAELRRTARSDVATARIVARVTGHLASASLVIGRAGRLYSRYLNDTIRDAAARGDYDSRVLLGPEALDELERWRARLGADLGSSAIIVVPRPAASAVLVTDASDSGYGGGIIEMDGDPVDVVARGVFEPVECSLNSSWRELRGAARVFASVAAQCAGRSVVLHVDSLVAAYVFASGGSQNRGPDGALDLHPEVLDLERTAARLGIDLGVVWWPREMNTLADVRSKIVDRGNYALSRAAFAEVERRFGPHTIDRFADDRNALLARFNSRWCCVGSEGVDALAIPWRGENNWLHPPTSIISRVIAKLRADRAAGTLLVPRWRAANPYRTGPARP